MNNAHLPRKWVSDKFVADYYEISRCSVWRWVKTGKLDPPKKIGPNTTRFDFEKIQVAESQA